MKQSYKKLYPTGAGTPKFYGLSKVHKAVVPLRPIVSSIGAVTYETSKELSKIPQVPCWTVTIPCPSTTTKNSFTNSKNKN